MYYCVARFTRKLGLSSDHPWMIPIFSKQYVLRDLYYEHIIIHNIFNSDVFLKYINFTRSRNTLFIKKSLVIVQPKTTIRRSFDHSFHHSTLYIYIREKPHNLKIETWHHAEPSSHEFGSYELRNFQHKCTKL